ncbi:MAG TPA: carboxypeptidase-like regulatory domain-containing protein [Acidobacteriaceae bacterium]|jgi:hypothetical protein
MQTNPPVFRCSSLVRLAAFCLCSLPLTAQAPNQPDTPDISGVTEHLNAVVVSSLDGRPVPRALVTSSDTHMAALTDSEGRFSFDIRRPGPQTAPHVFSSWPPDPVAVPTIATLEFSLRKPGYVTNQVSVRLPAVQPGDSEPTLQLKIVPAAVLTGHLDPDAGDLPPGTVVQFERKVVFNGVANWGYSDTQVNSRGEFRFSNLAPGDYKLAAPAYIPQSSRGDPSPDSVHGFRASFYPNADSIDSAGLIHLGPGETATANLTYHSATFYKVTIPVAGLPGDRGFYVNLLPEVQGLYLNPNQKDLTASGYLPSGDYTVAMRSAEIISQQNQFPATSTASVHLQVANRALRTEPAAFHPSLEIPVEVRREFTSDKKDLPPPRDGQRPTPEVWVGILSDTRGGLQPIAQNSQATTTIRNLSEGLFHIDVNSSVGGYVASVTSGTTDLLREPLRVVAGVAPRPIEITLRDDAALLNARVAPRSDQLPQATMDHPVYVLCLPLDRPEAEPINFATQSDQFPMASLPLPPGRYLLLAAHRQLLVGTPQTNAIEYRNPEVVRDLIPKGATITLSPNQKADIEIPVMPDEDAN